MCLSENEIGSGAGENEETRRIITHQEYHSHRE